MSDPARLDTSDIAYPGPGSRPFRRELDPIAPHVIVLFGCTGDLAKRKLLPGLAYLPSPSWRPRSASSGPRWRTSRSTSSAGWRTTRSQNFGMHRLAESDVGGLRRQADLRAAGRRGPRPSRRR